MHYRVSHKRVVLTVEFDDLLCQMLYFRSKNIIPFIRPWTIDFNHISVDCSNEVSVE